MRKTRLLMLLALLAGPALGYLAVVAYSPDTGTAAREDELDLEFEGIGQTLTGEAAWTALEQAAWFAEGAENPERIVYVFSDPQCPYCNRMWRASQPYLEQGLQVRNIIVAYLSPESEAQAAAILDAEDPAAHHARHQARFKAGGLAAEDTSERARQALARNNALRVQLNIPATPATYYKNEHGEVERVIGFPDPATLASDVFRMPELPQADADLAHR